MEKTPVEKIFHAGSHALDFVALIIIAISVISISFHHSSVINNNNVDNIQKEVTEIENALDDTKKATIVAVTLASLAFIIKCYFHWKGKA